MAQSSPPLFVLYDAGETHALEPVWELLDWHGADYQILALGTAAELCRQHPKLVDYGEPAAPEQRLDATSLSAMIQAVDPQRVLTGLVSVQQQQIAQALRDRGSRILGYYDAFARIQKASVAATFLNVVHELLVPAEEIKRDLGTQPCLIHVVGQPSLERWAALMRQPEPASLPRILCVGGYGEDYHLALPRMLAVAGDFSDCAFRLAVHPKVSGDFERECLAEHQADNLALVPATCTTLDAASESDLILCHRSTVGVQAAWLGIPVIYYDLPDASYSNLAIERGVVPQVRTHSALREAIQAGLGRGRRPPMEFFEQLGIPLRASREILKLLLRGHD